MGTDVLSASPVSNQTAPLAADDKKFEKIWASGKVLTLCKTTVQVKGFVDPVCLRVVLVRL